MKLIQTAKEKKELISLLQQYLSISDEVIGEVSENFSIETEGILDVLRKFRKRKFTFKEDFKLYKELNEPLSQKLPYFGFTKQELETPGENFIYREELIELATLRRKIHDLLIDPTLIGFVGHDLGHVQCDSFNPLRLTKPSSIITEFLWKSPEEVLNACLKNYENNCEKALSIIDYPFRFLYEIAGQEIKSQLTPREMTDSVIAALNNRFFHLIYGRGVKVQNSIPSELRFNSYPHCHLSFIYNTIKNALKRSGDLSGYSDKDLVKYGPPPIYNDLDHLVEMRVSTDETGRQYLVCSQNFEGPELYALAAKAPDFLENNKNLFPQGAGRRYETWLKSHDGREFKVLKIDDISSAMFVAGLSGYGISSYTSGLGLFGVKHILAKTTKSDVYWGFTRDDKRHHFAFRLTPAA